MDHERAFQMTEDEIDEDIVHRSIEYGSLAWLAAFFIEGVSQMVA